MNRTELSEYFKIIRRSVDDFDDPEVARPAVEAITSAAEHGSAQAQYMLGMYYYTYHCEDSSIFLSWMERAADSDNLKAIKFLADYYRFICDDMEPEQRKSLGRKWLYRLIEVLTKKAGKGVVSAAKSLMNLYVRDRPDDMTEGEGRDAAMIWYERLIEILRAKAARGTATDKKRLTHCIIIVTYRTKLSTVCRIGLPRRHSFTGKSPQRRWTALHTSIQHRHTAARGTNRKPLTVI